MTTRTKEKVTYESVIGLFDTHAAADAAWSAAMARGCNSSDLTIAVSEGALQKHFNIQDKTTGEKALQGAGAGGTVGIAVGAIAAVIAAAGASLIIPGLGIAIVGPLAAALAGAGAGGAVGGVVGALVAAGVSEAQSKEIENHLKKGGLVVVARTASERVADEIAKDWKPRASCIHRS